MCLQTLAEFGAADVPVALENLAGEREVHTLGALLPEPFRLRV
jgi:cytidine deaminase